MENEKQQAILGVIEDLCNSFEDILDSLKTLSFYLQPEDENVEE